MIYYKELDLVYADIVQAKTLQYIKDYTSILSEYSGYNWYPLNFKEFINSVPELYKAVEPLGLVPDEVALYVVEQLENSYMHIDAYHHRARINFPILNCDDSFTNFYTNAKIIKIFNEKNSRYNYKVINPAECILVDRVEIKKPVLLRVCEPHKVEVSAGSQLPRITLTVGFTTDPVSLLE